MSTIKLAWNEETTKALRAKAEAIGGDLITQEQVAQIAVELGAEFSDEKATREASARSVGSKLRKEGFAVQRADEVEKTSWTEDETAELVRYIQDSYDHANDVGTKTYAEIAAAILGGKYTRAQVQGKVLHLQLTDKVKQTPKAVAERKFNPEEEAKIISLVNSGEFLEDIADALDRTSRQIHGKCLSLLREERIANLPEQKVHKESARADVLADLDVATLTIAEIAEKTGKKEKGVKSMLTRRGLDCKDYKGSTRRAKLDDKAAKAE